MKKGKINSIFAGLTPLRVLSLGYLSIIILGTFLLMLPWASAKDPVSFMDALFTATSASCVTGLVVLDTGLDFSLFGQAVIILLIQLGGLGFMTLATMLFSISGRKVSLRSRMSAAEALGEDGLSGMAALCRRAAKYTLVCEGAGALVLLIPFIRDFGPAKGIWFAFFHSISAFCNAGFDLLGNFTSVTVYHNDPFVLMPIVLLVILGGLGFAVIGELAAYKKTKRLSLHAKLVLIMTAALLVLGMVITLIFEWDNPLTLGGMDLGEKLLSAFFQSMTLRTAGFNSIDQVGLRGATKFLSVIFMVIGAAPAGTAGGIKVTTVAVLLLTVRSFMGNRQSVTAFDRKIGIEPIRKALVLAVSAVGILVFATSVISAMNMDTPFLDCLFECASAIGTVGISAGITAAGGTATRLLLCLLMYMGRAGILTLALAIGGPGEQELISYPDGRVMIG